MSHKVNLIYGKGGRPTRIEIDVDSVGGLTLDAWRHPLPGVWAGKPENEPPPIDNFTIEIFDCEISATYEGGPDNTTPIFNPYANRMEWL